MNEKETSSFTENLGNPETWAKVAVLLVTAPIWFPIVRTMLREIHEVLAPEGGLYASNKPRPIAERPPGEDPFLNIPYRRGRQGPADIESGTGTNAPGRGRAVHDVTRRRRGF